MDPSEPKNTTYSEPHLISFHASIELYRSSIFIERPGRHESLTSELDENYSMHQKYHLKQEEL